MAKFVYVENGKVVERHDLLPVNWNGLNLNELSEEELLAKGWFPTKVEEPLGWNGMTHTFHGPEFVIGITSVLEKYWLEERSAEEIAEMAAQAEAQRIEAEARQAEEEARMAELLGQTVQQEVVDSITNNEE